MNEQKTAIHAGHRSRIRDRFRQEGLSAFSEHEVLELLLTYAIPQRDVNPLAHTLIARFGSLAGVLNATESELTLVTGVGQNAASLLTLMPQLLGYYQRNAMGERPLITNFHQARQFVQALYFGAREELAYMICLDGSGRLIHPVLLRRGTIDEVPIYPRDVVSIALRHNASAILLAHNHPGGNHEPSQADYDTTRVIIDALRIIGIKVIDHLVVCGETVYSMTKSSEFGVQTSEDFSYMMQDRVVPGRRGKLREVPEDAFLALCLDD